MNFKIHKASTRGAADLGWLQARYSFSFANYHNPERMGFGKLRVINDDIIAPGAGFGDHPHRNMEIVTIPLEGGIRHGDSMENSYVIRHGEVQVMSAGTGIVHSEYNASNELAAATLQIWVLPAKHGVKPRYDKKKFNFESDSNRWHLLVSPDGREGSLFIYQNAFFSFVNLEKNKKINYSCMEKGQGIYFFVVDGMVLVENDHTLEKRDGLAISEVESIEVHAQIDSKLLAIEVPL